MVDGYEGYAPVCERQALRRLGCWAHARRKYVEAQRAAGKHKSAKADYAVKLIGKLYALEKTLIDVEADVRHRHRLQQAQPVVDKLRVWLQQTLPAVPPKTALGKALHYLHHQWPRLIGYLEDGRYPIGRVDDWRGGRRLRGFAVSGGFRPMPVSRSAP